MFGVRELVAAVVQGFVFVLVAVVSFRTLESLHYSKSQRVLLVGAVAGLASVGVGRVLRGDHLHLVVLPATALAFALLALVLLRLLCGLLQVRERRRVHWRSEITPTPRELRKRRDEREDHERDAS